MLNMAAHVARNNSKVLSEEQNASNPLAVTVQVEQLFALCRVHVNKQGWCMKPV